MVKFGAKMVQKATIWLLFKLSLVEMQEVICEVLAKHEAQAIQMVRRRTGRDPEQIKPRQHNRKHHG